MDHATFRIEASLLSRLLRYQRADSLPSGRDLHELFGPTLCVKEFAYTVFGGFEPPTLISEE